MSRSKKGGGGGVNQSLVKTCNWRDDKALFSFDPRQGTFFFRGKTSFIDWQWGGLVVVVQRAVGSYWDG